MIPRWANAYVGIPFAPHGRTREGCDCWGLVRLVLADRFGVLLPEFHGYEGAGDRDGIPALLNEGKAMFMPVPMHQERAGDVVLALVNGAPMHVGVVVEPGVMLHVVKGADACIEDYRRPAWSSRIEGIYRHEAMA
jgi:lipoprotein Spr